MIGDLMTSLSSEGNILAVINSYLGEYARAPTLYNWLICKQCRQIIEGISILVLTVDGEVLEQ